MLVIKFDIQKANASFLRRNQGMLHLSNGYQDAIIPYHHLPFRASASRLRTEASTHACAAEIGSGNNQNQEQAQIASENDRN